MFVRFLDRNKLKNKILSENTLITFKAVNSYREVSVFQRPYTGKYHKFVTGRTGPQLSPSLRNCGWVLVVCVLLLSWQGGGEEALSSAHV